MGQSPVGRKFWARFGRISSVQSDVVLSTPSITVHASGNPFRLSALVTRFTVAKLAEPPQENCCAKTSDSTQGCTWSVGWWVGDGDGDGGVARRAPSPCGRVWVSRLFRALSSTLFQVIHFGVRHPRCIKPHIKRRNKKALQPDLIRHVRRYCRVRCRVSLVLSLSLSLLLSPFLASVTVSPSWPFLTRLLFCSSSLAGKTHAYVPRSCETMIFASWSYLVLSARACLTADFQYPPRAQDVNFNNELFSTTICAQR